jgi:hypothetical protein
MQHHLGGFLLRSLDADDPDDRCNNGAGFPLLAAARAASCDQPKAAVSKNHFNLIIGWIELGPEKAD